MDNSRRAVSQRSLDISADTTKWQQFYVSKYTQDTEFRCNRDSSAVVMVNVCDCRKKIDCLL